MPTMHHQPAQHQHHLTCRRPLLEIGRLQQLGKPHGHRRQVDRAEHAGQQADAVEHDARRAGSVDGIFQRRFAALPAALEHAGQHIRRNARHLDAEKHHQQMVGRRHDAHAQRGAEHQRVDIGRGVAIGNARKPGEDREQARRTSAAACGNRP